MCTAETVDLVVRAGFGSRLGVVGPLEQSDLSGTDLTLAIHEVLMPDLDDTPRPTRTCGHGRVAATSAPEHGQGFRSLDAGEAERRRAEIAAGAERLARDEGRAMARWLTDLYDVAVVGAGIVGLAVGARAPGRHPGFSVVVLEREHEVGLHQTGHNSGVIHSGVYYKPGSLKARLCVEGARLMYEFCDERRIPYERCGKLIVALTADELPRLDELEARGRANGVRGLRRLSRGRDPARSSQRPAASRRCTARHRDRRLRRWWPRALRADLAERGRSTCCTGVGRPVR